MHGAGLDTRMARINKTRSVTFTRSRASKDNSSATAIPNLCVSAAKSMMKQTGLKGMT